MAGLFPKLAAMACLLLLAGCNLAAPLGGKPGGDRAPAANPVTGAPIEVTPLDAPSSPAPSSPALSSPSAAPAAVTVVHRPGPDTPRPQPRPAGGAEARPSEARPSEARAAAGATAPDPAAVSPVVPAPAAAAEEKSAARLSCEKRKGQWVETGKGGAFGCITPTRDALKECTRSAQCEGACLARSGTCAPYVPLFGCNEVFDDSGRRMTQCLD